MGENQIYISLFCIFTCKYKIHLVEWILLLVWMSVLGLLYVKEVQSVMARCAICEKGAHFGNNVSHSHRRSNKMWKSNIKSVKVKVNGAAKKMYVCTSCLKSGKVERA